MDDKDKKHRPKEEVQFVPLGDGRSSEIPKQNTSDIWAMKNKNPGCLGIEGMKYYPVMWGLWKAIIRIPIKQPVVIIQIKSFFFFVAHMNQGTM